jgi:hypothetical protein
VRAHKTIIHPTPRLLNRTPGVLTNSPPSTQRSRAGLTCDALRRWRAPLLFSLLSSLFSLLSFLISIYGWLSGGRKSRGELAGGEGVEGAEAIGEFGVTQAAITVKTPQKVDGGAFSFLGIAFQTTRDQVAVGIAAELGLRHDMVKAASHGCEVTQTIKATATFARVDGPAEGRRLQEIHVPGIDGAGKAGRQTTADSTGSSGACSTDFVRQEHLNHVSGLAALKQAQDTARNEATYGPTGGVGAEAGTAGEPENRESQLPLPFQAAVPEEMRIDGAVRGGEAQPRDEMVFELFPDLCGVGFFVFHGLSPELAGARHGGRLRIEIWDDLGKES